MQTGIKQRSFQAGFPLRALGQPLSSLYYHPTIAGRETRLDRVDALGSAANPDLVPALHLVAALNLAAFVRQRAGVVELQRRNARVNALALE